MAERSTCERSSIDRARDKSVALLNEWAEYCIEQSRLHGMARGHYKKIHKLLFVPATILGSVSGVSMISTSITEGNTIFGVVFGVMSLVGAGLMTIHNNFEIVDKINMNDLYGDAFYNLSNEIKVHLTLDESESRGYRDIAEIVKEMRHRLEILIDKAPAIPGSVDKKKKECVLKRESSAEGVVIQCCTI